jgi:uncharacterized GH25 family protein
MSASLIRRVLAAALLVGAAGSAVAHDFWIEASTWRPAAKDLVSFDLRIGHPGESEPFGRNPARFRRFVASRAGASADDGTAEIAILGRDGRAPAGFARFEKEGLYRVAYESQPVWIELAAEKFAKYLVEEGLEKVAAQRTELGEAEGPGRELYSRCAIAVVAVGAAAAADANWGAPLGLELELVPAVNPMSVAVGGELELRLFFQGKALEGALVCLDALHGAAIDSAMARTDAEGRVRFTITAPGGYLATAVDMQRAADDVRTREVEPADWTSQWASLSFEIAAPSE